MCWLPKPASSEWPHERSSLSRIEVSGRYKAVVVDGSGSGYLKTVCDYVHLNPARARMLGTEDRLLAYPWSSLPWHLAAREHRPGWLRTDRLLGEHGIQEDSAAGRQEFERRMEERRREESEEDYTKLRRGWCLGGEGFQEKLLEMMAGSLGESHSGQLRTESAEAKAERIIAEELRPPGLDAIGLGSSDERRSGKNGDRQPASQRDRGDDEVDCRTVVHGNAEERPAALA